MRGVGRYASALVVLILQPHHALSSATYDRSDSLDITRSDEVVRPPEHLPSSEVYANTSSFGGHRQTEVQLVNHHNVSSWHRVEGDDWTVPAGLEQVEEGMSVLCGMKETPWSPDQAGNLHSMVQHDLMCGDKQFLATWRLHRGRSATHYKFQYKCCSLVTSVGKCEDRVGPYRDSAGGSLIALGQLSPTCPGGKLMKGWRMLQRGKDIAVRTRCCGFYGKAKVGKCLDAKTMKTTASRDIRRLARHDIQCKYGYALSRWQLHQPSRSQFLITYTCCMAGDVVAASVGPRRTCRWVGDPHFVTFDGGRHDTTKPGSGAAFWLVKSKDVNIQSFYQGARDWTPALTVGVVAFGRFLQGHKLVIKKDVPRLKTRNAALLDLGSNASEELDLGLRYGNVVKFDDRQIRDNQQFRHEGLLQVTRKGSSVRASLPLGVEININLRSYYMDNAITMGEPPGGQVGQCGNNNGNRGDDQRLMGTYPVAQKDNMFLNLSPQQAGTAKKLSDCRGAARDRAVEVCSHKFKGKKFFQDFLNMCIFDNCFTKEGDELATGDRKAEAEAQKGVAAQKPRRFIVPKPKHPGPKQYKACHSSMELVKITSESDQMAVMLAISEQKAASKMVWVGAKYHGGKWVWGDGDPVCGFENWDTDTKRRLKRPLHNFLCIDKRSGKWHTCPPASWNHVVCMDRKQYALQSFTGPLEARTACGDSHKLAMPKSDSEQRALMQVVKSWGASKAYIWLGAGYRNDRWEWDDGSKVCWTNWDQNEPNIKDKQGQLFMGMSAKTGKWRVFSGYKTFHDVICETNREGLSCPLSRFNPSHLGLSVNPTEMSSEVSGQCYYMGQGQETCHETCWRQMDGYCSEAGLSLIAHSKGACKLAVAGFGGIGGKSQTSTTVGDIGCTYKDMGSPGGVAMTEVVLASGRPTCSARTSSASHHRLCACKDDVLMTYPLNHVVTNGDTVRVCGMGYNERKPFKILLKGGGSGARPGALLESAESADQRLQDWLAWAEDMDRRAQGNVTASLLGENENTTAEDDRPRHWFRPKPGARRLHRLELEEALAHRKRAQQHGRQGSGSGDFATLSTPQQGQAVTSGSPNVAASNLVSGGAGGEAVTASEHQRASEAEAAQAAATQADAMVDASKSQSEDAVLSDSSPTWMNLKEARTQQSSTILGGNARRAVDGNTDGRWTANSCTHTGNQVNPWWEVDLGQSRRVKEVKVTNRADCCGSRLSPFTVTVDGQECAKNVKINQGQQLAVRCAGDGVEGRNVKVEVLRKVYLTICEVEVAAEGGTAGDRGGSLGAKDGPPILPGEISWGRVQKQDREGQLKASLEFDPVAKTATRRYFNSKGDFVSSQMPWWDMASSKTPWCLDLEATYEEWKVRINGKDYPELSFVHYHGSYVTHINTDVHTPHFMLIPPEPVSLKNPVSANMINGCKDHPYTRTGKVITFTFKIRPKNVYGTPCIRCEPRPADQGTHLYFNNGKLVLAVDGAEPRIQTFDRRFHSNLEYDLDVSYNSLDKVVELYVNKQRRGMLGYVKAPKFLLKPGYLGCASNDPDDGRMLQGQVFDFQVTHKIPETRPLQDKCSSLAGLGVACPEGQVFRRNPHTINCKSDVCVASDVATCCVARMKCMEYTCPRDTVQRSDFHKITCKGTNCHPLECCLPKALCNSFSCPPGRALKKGPEMISCLKDKCTSQDDLEACCDTLSTCDSFNCPEGYTRISAANNTFCSDRVCSATDYSRCCAQNGRCATLPCRDGYVNKVHARNIPCKDVQCVASEHDKCCDRRAHCTSYECAAHEVLRYDANFTMCATQTCTSTDSCCVAKGRCNWMHCPLGWVQIDRPEQTMCDDQWCKDTDYKRCCQPKATCAGYECPAEYTPKADVQVIFCHGLNCTNLDRDTCCDPFATCNSTLCPPNKVHIHNASTTLCGGALCNATDHAKCCTSASLCASIACPAGYVHAEWAHMMHCYGDRCTEQDFGTCCVPQARCSQLECPARKVNRHDAANVFCRGPKCLLEEDTDTCCVPMGSCLTMPCPSHQLHRPNAKNIVCKNSTCEPQDLQLCCDDRASCSTWTCPWGQVLAHNASSTYCANTACTEVDTRSCCTRAGRCSSLKCPETHVLVPNAGDRSCASSNCSSEDYGHCCDKRAFCSSLSCPSWMVHIPDAAKRLCQGARCDDRDIHTCCIARGTCSSFDCPNGTIIRKDPSNILCKDAQCKDTDWRYCCVEVGKCSSMTCPAGLVHRYGAADINCASGLCGIADEDVCCIEASPCSTTACPTNMVLRQTPEMCGTSDCSSDKDIATCCIQKGSCSSFHCPQSYVLRPNAQDLRCSDQACVETDYTTCCVAQESCLDFVCPDKYVLKHQYESILCAKDRCTELDRDKCCDRRATCESLQCPSTLLPSMKARSMMCRGTSCTPEEFANCCVPRTSCESLACPPGYIHKEEARDMMCKGENCTDDDVDQCCTILSTCDRFECPFGFGSKMARFSMAQPALPAPAPSLLEGLEEGLAVHQTCSSLQHFCTRDPSGGRCDEITNPEECDASFGKQANEGTVLCIWRRSTCEAQDFAEAMCQLSPDELVTACKVFACKYEVEVSRMDLDKVYSIILSDAPGRTFKFEGCSAASEAGRTCLSEGGSAGARVLRNNKGEAVAAGGCCESPYMDQIEAVKSSCPSVPDSALWTGTGWTFECRRNICEKSECCDALATCDQLRCPHGFSHVFNARGTFCNGPYCDESDTSRCCVKLATCADYACPEDLILHRDAQKLLCSGEACTKADQEVCCRRPSSCATMACPLRTHVPKVGSSHTICWSSPCNEADLELCCDERASCHNFGLCPHGTTPSNTSKRCARTTCGNEDIRTCCDSHSASCAFFDCPANYVLRDNAGDIACDSHNCEQADFHTCCMEAANCSTYACPNTHILREEAEELRCQRPQCDQGDTDLCCERKASCETATCPVTMVRNPGAAGIPCAGRLCADVDAETCCLNRAPCSNMRCPRDMVLRIMPGIDILCEGINCRASDSDHCCETRAVCSPQACGDAYSLRPGAEHLLCSGAQCTPAIDEEACCMEKGTCGSFHCPAGYSNKESAHDVACGDTHCREMDYHICCEPQARCDTFICPEGKVPAADAADITCFHSTCGVWDAPRCCRDKAPCDSYKCPIGYRQRPDASELKCAWSSCTDHDLHICCAEDTTCSSYSCPLGTVRRPRAHEIDCPGGDCKAIEDAVCCAIVGMCDSLACPQDMVHKADAHEIICQGSECNMTDVHSCCEYPAMCNTLDSCPEAWEKVDYPEAIPCKTSACNISVDLKTCCRQTGKCTCFECPEGYSHRYNAWEIPCHDGNCSAAHTNYTTCCIEDGTCGSFQCPHHFVHKPDADSLRCRDIICRDADKYRCCSQKHPSGPRVRPPDQKGYYYEYYLPSSNKSHCPGAGCIQGERVTTTSTTTTATTTPGCNSTFPPRHAYYYYYDYYHHATRGRNETVTGSRCDYRMGANSTTCSTKSARYCGLLHIGPGNTTYTQVDTATPADAVTSCAPVCDAFTECIGFELRAGFCIYRKRPGPTPECRESARNLAHELQGPRTCFSRLDMACSEPLTQQVSADDTGQLSRSNADNGASTTHPSSTASALRVQGLAVVACLTAPFIFQPFRFRT